MIEIPKAYDPKEVEDKIYKKWEESGAFNPDNLVLPKNAKTFSIAMPPPNVTGILHLGHALENTLMDTMIRYQRMQGKRALLIPGTDHAAVATQARVEKDLVKSGKYKNPREELGREKLLEISVIILKSQKRQFCLRSAKWALAVIGAGLLILLMSPGAEQ